MTLPEEGKAGIVVWHSPKGRPYSVIVAPDFGVTEEALEAWDRYKEELGIVNEVLVSFTGIPGLPSSEHDLARFVALGSRGTGLALSGANCGYGGEGPHGTARILRELGIGENVVTLVFSRRSLHLVRLEDGWMAELDPKENREGEG